MRLWVRTPALAVAGTMNAPLFVRLSSSGVNKSTDKAKGAKVGSPRRNLPPLELILLALYLISTLERESNVLCLSVFISDLVQPPPLFKNKSTNTNREDRKK